ncbi:MULTISPECIES: IMPACT family protein [unclassified Arsukibacterium]|uniref:IMPACT family protein n=1 Tax=unclassified Arsukibacterium TaxID=2635278 RepID=UPI000C66A62E|nr:MULTISPECIES: YigZ family protein [unclassified Arsukibacterium]MAA93488.1 IMPACT family protein [Rheinheimera sp.]MBM33000.1 IMPACT family protein [Rheinheimera sp.]HAW92945.1 IMPACT family protein [Candidatus Azambacteria bacterium]
MNPYTELAAPVEHCLTEKNSEFLSFLLPVRSRDEAMALVNQYREQYRGANHVCWAYIMGNTRQPETQAFSDDGEPGGTAGKPMLHVLTEQELGNCLALVVRYFGGVKLGAGGLVRAYSAAVSQAAVKATRNQVLPQLQLTVRLDFALETRARQLISELAGQLLATDYQQQVQLTVSLPVTAAAEFANQLQNISSGSALISELPDTAQA